MKGGKERGEERETEKEREKERSSVKYQGRVKALMSGARLLIRRIWASSDLIGKVLFKFKKKKKKTMEWPRIANHRKARP